MTATSQSAESRFEQAIRRYQEGEPPASLIGEFESITAQAPKLAAGWTCLAWLLLLDEQPEAALRSARTAVKLSPQDPQSRVNLSVAMLETGAKGVREHIDMVLRVTALAPELGAELQDSIQDGLRRRPGWKALEKVRNWLQG
jgi:predicted Zn-dependent protease